MVYQCDQCIKDECKDGGVCGGQTDKVYNVGCFNQCCVCVRALVMLKRKKCTILPKCVRIMEGECVRIGI